MRKKLKIYIFHREKLVCECAWLAAGYLLPGGLWAHLVLCILSTSPSGWYLVSIGELIWPDSVVWEMSSLTKVQRGNGLSQSHM